MKKLIASLLLTLAATAVALAQSAPVISVQPANITVTQGQGAVFVVQANGSPAPTYQWRKNGFDIPGATLSSYSLVSVTTADAASFDVLVSNASGTVLSNSATLTVNVTPTVTAQPLGLTVNQGASASFSVTAGGTPAPTYQWRKNGATIAGATSTVFSLSNVGAADAATYDVVVTNAAGSATSSGAVLAVVLAPVITAAPSSVATTATSAVVFSVTVSGTAPFTYQWRKNGSAIPGATSSTYNILSAAQADTGNYDVVVTNAAGTAISTFATLTLNQPPGIITQPYDVTTQAGATVSFTVEAAGTGGLSFQWQKFNTLSATWGNLTGASNAVLFSPGGTYTSILTLANVSSTDVTSYRCIVTGGIAPAATSAAAALTLVTGPSITAQPVAQTVTLGGSAVFSVTATGSGTLTYQWRKAGSPISGATYSSLSFGSVTALDAADYDVVVTNSVGSVTSAIVALAINSLPTVTTQPVSAVATQGQTASFSVVATGTPTPTYQWRMNGVAIGSATTATLTIPNVTASNSGNYDVVISNSVGAIVSSAASLSVNVPPTIQLHPTPFSITVGGSSVIFSVSATGTGAFSYQWKKGGTVIFDGATGNSSSISGATTSQLAIANAQTADAGVYTVSVANSYGSATSLSNGVLTVLSSGTVVPSVTGQPVPQTIAEGNLATFSIVTAGTAGLTPAATYQWFKNNASTPLSDGATGTGSTIIGATSASLIISNAQLTDTASYFVQVTASSVPVTVSSSPAALTVTKLPAFTVHPAGSTINAGGSYTLTSTVNASGTVVYQWFKNGVLVPGATGSSLAIAAAVAADAGNYTVTATNNVGSATSNAATLVVNYAPIISVQPTSAVTVGQSATLSLSVVAAGSPAPTYQWRKDATPLSGQTSATLTIGGVQATDSGSYDVQVTNSVTTTTSSASTVTVIATPTITVQPTGGSFTQGQSTTLSVTATGGGTLVYQWYKDNVALAGAKSASLPLTSLVGANAGVYYVLVANAAGSASSSAVSIAVTTMPSITTQPESKTAIVGDAVTFSVVATGNPTPTYQWSKGNLLISGATGSTYSIAGVQKTDAGVYRVAVSNSLGTVNSSFASLAVNDPPQVAPSITTQPVGVTGTAGSAITLSVVATGSGTLTYQWRKDGTAISGATNSSLTLAGTVADSGSYTVVVANTVSSVTSSAAVVSLKAPVPLPVIVAQSGSRTLAAGADITLSVQATGQGPLTYQWFVNGNAISGATGTSLALTSVTAASGGVYTVKVTNEGGTTTSANISITVSTANAAPVITRQPTPQVAVVGGSATFTVVATGTPAPSYQWRKNGANIAGATTATLTLNNVASADAASYDVVLLNSSGQAISALARLTVNAAATAPVITRQPAEARVIAGRSATFTVVANGSPSPSYQWRKDGTAISGATSDTLTLSNVTTAQAGTYSVIVTNSAGGVTSNNATLAVLARSYAGTWLGTLGSGGSFALVINDDNTGAFLGFVPGTKTAYVSRSVTVDDNGAVRFTATTTASVAASLNPGLAGENTAAAVDDLAFSGTIASDSSLNGAATTSAALAFSAARSNDAGTSAAYAGFYQIASSGSSAQALVIVSPAGQSFVLTQAGSTVDAGTGTADSAGRVTVTTAGSQSVVANITAETGAVSAVVFDSKNASTAYAGFASGSSALGNQRLSNISTRAPAGFGAESVIVGFVVTGLESKTVLIRAVGPTLRTFGLSNTAAAPRLDLARGTTTLATNIGWTSTGSPTAEIIAAAAGAGAFPLQLNSADSVILTTLPPGNYTASCSAADARTGLALVEVYDLSGGSTAQKLANISTRALTGPGENVLTAGVVVTGSAPKRVLIRAAGPALTQFGLTGALARPQLTLINSAGASVATNAGWSTSADATAITEAAVRAGAFAFTAGSADAALLVNLAPGNYTAQVSGVGGTSGIALVEVYELP